MPMLRPVKVKSEETLTNNYWEEKGAKISNEGSNFLMGSFLDVPVGREIQSSGMFFSESPDCYSCAIAFDAFSST